MDCHRHVLVRIHLRSIDDTERHQAGKADSRHTRSFHQKSPAAGKSFTFTTASLEQPVELTGIVGIDENGKDISYSQATGPEAAWYWNEGHTITDSEAQFEALEFLAAFLKDGDGHTSAGLKLLTDNLQRLINDDESVVAIFSAAKIDQYDDHGTKHTAREWADLFKTRAQIIIDSRCALW